jgi:carboxyl-terminal processing protease
MVKAKRDELEEEQRAMAILKNRKPLDFGGKDDFQLAQAINHFKGLPVKVAKADPGDLKPASSAQASPAPGSETKPPELKGAPQK